MSNRRKSILSSSDYSFSLFNDCLRLIMMTLLALLLIEQCSACSRSRMIYRSRRLMNTHVFVEEEYQPSQWERNVEASGPLVRSDFIRSRDDSRLIRVKPDPNIYFNNEASRLMTKGCWDRLRKLSTFVQNYWPDQKVYLQVLRAWTPAPSRRNLKLLRRNSKFINPVESKVRGYQRPNFHDSESENQYTNLQLKTMDEFHWAGRAVDLTLFDESYTKHKRYAGKLAQLAIYSAGFDWCIFTKYGHVHCSVKPDDYLQSKWYGCFHSTGRVTLSNGSTTTMKEVQIGDKILSVSAQGDLTYSPVVMFLHYSPDSRGTDFVRITTVSNQSLMITPNHLVYRSQVLPLGKPINLSSSDQYEVVFAASLKVNDQMFVQGRNSDRLRSEKIIRLERLSENIDRGVYAPLTETGNIIVDGIVVSCYAQFSSERLAQVAMYPYLAYLKFTGHSDTGPLPSDFSGVHWYPKILWNLSQLLFPSSFFFSNTPV